MLASRPYRDLTPFAFREPSVFVVLRTVPLGSTQGGCSIAENLKAQNRRVLSKKSAHVTVSASLRSMMQYGWFAPFVFSAAIIYAPPGGGCRCASCAAAYIPGCAPSNIPTRENTAAASVPGSLHESIRVVGMGCQFKNIRSCAGIMLMVR